MENIVWKRLIYHNKDLGDYYLVSNTGEIKGVKTGKIRKKHICNEGYYMVSISIGSRKDKPSIKVHRAVAETFLENPNNYPVINHKDGNKLNNYVDNLEFCTYQYNVIHAIKNNLSNHDYCKKRIKNITTNVIYDSITDAALKYNPSNVEGAKKNIGDVLLKQNRKTAYGCEWCYI